jgi:hypothetical protein
MTVPGTFKNRPPAPVKVAGSERVRNSLLAGGSLLVEFWDVGECSVILSRDPIGVTGERYRWHLSIAHRSRYPTWDEIKVARYGIPTLEGVDQMVQLLPRMTAGRAWTNLHDNCFHLYETTPDINLLVT